MNIKQKETSVEEKLTTDEKTAPDLLVDDIEGDKTEGPDDSGKREYDTELPDDPGEKDIYARVVLRKDVKEQIFRDAPKDKDNNPLDPNTGLPIKGTPDIGHKPGHEHWRERIRAREEKLTREEFIEKMNDPDIYQLEDPSNNRCHKYEDKGDETV
ncbi:MAG: HNH/ENDO VII family nuclease [Oscillospiraceae bacterium]|nr:HNH/ENDO VII family nuclease [Oscillospiraceae bacterium]